MPLSHPTSSKPTRLWIVCGRLVWPQSRCLGGQPWPLVLGCPFLPANFLCVNGEISCYSILQDMLRLLPASREGMCREAASTSKSWGS